MQQDDLILVLVSWSLFMIVVPASAAPSQVAKPINTAIENQHSHESLPGDAEKQKSKPERVFTKDESNEPVEQLNGNYGKVKWDDALDQEEQQQPKVDPKLDDFSEYEEQQPRVDPKIRDTPEQEVQAARVDPKFKDNPEQEEQQAGVNPKFKDTPEQEEQQARADPKIKDTPEQEEQPRVDPKFKDTPEQEEQQARADPKFKDTPEQEEQPRVDPKFKDTPEQEEQQARADPKFKDTPEQEGQQARADPKFKDTPEQEEQPRADPKIKDTPEQEEQQARADPKIKDTPEQEEQQARADPKIKDTPEQEEQQPRDDPKLTNTRDHNNELSVANSDYDEPSGQINKPNVNGPGKAKAETRTQNLSKDSKLSEVSDDNMEDTQNPGDTEVQKDTDTSNTAFAVVKEDGTSNTGRESAGGNSSSVQNSDVKDREEPEGDIQRKDSGNTQSRPSIPSSISSNLPVTPLPTSKLQGLQDGNIYPKGSKKVSSATKTSTSTTTTVSSPPIVDEIAKPDDYLTGVNEVAKPSNSQSENDSPYDDYNNIMDPREEEEFEVKPARSENAPPEVNNGGKFRDDEDSHFFAYFLTIMVTAIIFYLVFHNKQRIIALIIEGRAPRSSRTRRSSSRAKYHKLDNNLEEAITATKGSNFAQS